MDQLQADPAYQARRAQKELEIARRVAELDRAEAPLVHALQAAGIMVKRGVWDLVNTGKPYPAALPILLEHLQKPYPVEIREGIARALAVRGSRFAWPLLAKLFREEPESRFREALAIAVAEAADESVLAEVITMAEEPKYGEYRVHLLSALKRSKDPRAFKSILSLARDPAFEYEVNKYLRAREKRQHRDRRRDHQ